MAIWSEFLDVIYAPTLQRIPEQHEEVLEKISWGDEFLSRTFDLEAVRQTLYLEYDEMDARSSDISVALDMVADETTSLDPREKKAVWVSSDNQHVIDLADALFERVDLEGEARQMVRTLAKYGELMRYALTVTPEDAKGLDTDFIGVLALEEVDALQVNRVEERGQLVGFRTQSEELPPWQILHWRLPGAQIFGSQGQVRPTKYGRSYIEGARGLWRALKVAEESVLLARVDRAVNTTVLPIPIEGANPHELPKLMNEWRRAIGRYQYQNPVTGAWVQRYNPFSRESLLVWPTMPGTNFNVQELGGSPDIRAIVDLQYWRDKMFAILRIPKEFLQAERRGGGILGKDLSLEDIRFGRLIRMFQRTFSLGIMRLLQTELAMNDIAPDSEFEINMSTSSFIEETQRLEVLKSAVEVAENLQALGQRTGLVDTAEFQAFVLDTIVTFVGSSLGLEQLADALEKEEVPLLEPEDPDFGVQAAALSDDPFAKKKQKATPAESKEFYERISKGLSTLREGILKNKPMTRVSVANHSPYADGAAPTRKNRLKFGNAKWQNHVKDLKEIKE
jgi:hypothetical protein